MCHFRLKYRRLGKKVKFIKDVQTPKLRDAKRRKRVRGDEEDEVNDKEGKTLENLNYFHSMEIL